MYDTNKLKTISLDPKHDLVLKAFKNFLAKLECKHNSLVTVVTNQSNKITQHAQQITKLESEQATQSKLLTYQSNMVAQHSQQITTLEVEQESSLQLMTNQSQQIFVTNNF